MKKIFLLLLTVVIIFPFIIGTVSANKIEKESVLPVKVDSLSNILTVIDGYRGLSVDYYVEMSINYFKEKILKSQNLFSLWVDVASNDRNVLLRYLAPENEKNNLILSKNNMMWVQNKKTSRPIPISMSQRLLGNASVGDVISVQMKDNYEGTITKAGDTLLLELKAKNNKVLYKKVNMAIDNKKFRPIKAEFMTAGGKLLKSVYYSKYKTYGTKEVLADVIIVDAVNTGNVTKLSFRNYKADKIPQSYFNKNYLSKISFE